MEQIDTSGVQTMKSNRYQELLESFHFQGLIMRQDSQLIKDYIETGGVNTGIQNVNDIIENLVRMDFLLNKTRYYKILRRSGLHPSQFLSKKDYYKYIEPIQAIAALNWMKRFKMPLYMVPSVKLRTNIVVRDFQGWEGLIVPDTILY